MTIKTFNVDEDVYQKFSSHCKENGLSMSKQVTWFMQSQIEEEPNVRASYLRKLEKMRKEPTLSFNSANDLIKSLRNEKVHSKRKTK